MYIYAMNDKVKFFKALGDETRLQIVGYLLMTDHCACDFTSGINKDQTTISRHLKILVEAGILKYEKEGRNIIYSIRNGDVRNMLVNMGIECITKCGSSVDFCKPVVKNNEMRLRDHQ
ncbi:MAG: winged helix-turn-helix transcriptional regulator [Methanosarcinales archaeon]|nr:winged helix-turn-helix transcriptional regulator [Methanosarcinales archaeon]